METLFVNGPVLLDPGYRIAPCCCCCCCSCYCSCCCCCQYQATPEKKERTVAQDSSSLMISLPKFSVELLFHISTKVGSCAHSFKTFMLITLFIHVLLDIFSKCGLKCVKDLGSISEVSEQIRFQSVCFKIFFCTRRASLGGSRGKRFKLRCV